MNYEEYFDGIKGKKVAVAGIGISNTPLIRLLVESGAEVTACDLKKTYDDLSPELKDLGIEFQLGKDYLKGLSKYDVIFRSPGIRYDIPEFEDAVKNGAKLTSEMEVFMDVCPSHIIAVTGSDGKTTTTTLISEMLKREGYTVWLGGNIGTPLLSLADKMSENDYAVLELSSFQLHTMKKSPEIAVITNITPNHLDVHKSYEEYIDAKKNIMLYQNKDDILVTNAGNDITNKISEDAKGVLRTFSSKTDAFIKLENNYICAGGRKILNINDIKIPGMHNVENYMAAIGAVMDVVSDENIVKVAEEFGGVQHRIELVRVLDGVKYYNSSIDSSPNRTINTLRVFKNKVIMISGGKDKGIPYDELGKPIIDSVKVLILIGATSGVIEKSVNDAYRKYNLQTSVKIIHCDTYEDAVNAARKSAKDGDTVLLSPASTSFDMFKNFEERGNTFKRIVNSL